MNIIRDIQHIDGTKLEGNANKNTQGERKTFYENNRINSQHEYGKRF